MASELPGRREAAQTTPRSPPSWATWAVIGASVAVMTAAGLWGLDRGSMWQDESVSLEVSRRTWWQILALIRRQDAVHALYYLILHVWMIPGGGEVWMRVPSVIAAAVAAGLVAALGTRLQGLRAGLFAGLLFAVWPFVSYYAQEGRSYAMVTAAVLLATYALVRAVETGARRWWLGYLAAFVVAVGLHEFALLVLPAQAAGLLIGRVTGPVWRRWAGCALIGGLAATPLIWLSQRQSGQVGWLTRPDAASVLELLRLLLGPSPWVMAVMLVAILAALIAPASRAPGMSLVAVAAPLAAVPPILLLIASQITPLYHPRYVFFSVAGTALLAGAGVDRLVALSARDRRPAWLPWLLGLVVIAGVSAAQLPEHQRVRTLESRTNDLAGAARLVAQGARPGDGVLFLPSRYRAAALGYPDAFAGLTDVGLARTPIEASNLRGTNLSSRRSRTAMLAQDRLWVVGRPGLSVRTTETLAGDQQAVLREQFVPIFSGEVHGMEVALYVRSPDGSH